MFKLKKGPYGGLEGGPIDQPYKTIWIDKDPLERGPTGLRYHTQADSNPNAERYELFELGAEVATYVYGDDFDSSGGLEATEREKEPITA